jgi:hypothetical protein
VNVNLQLGLKNFPKTMANGLRGMDGDTEIPLSAVNLPRNGIIDGIFISVCTMESILNSTLQWLQFFCCKGNGDGKSFATDGKSKILHRLTHSDVFISISTSKIDHKGQK